MILWTWLLQETVSCCTVFQGQFAFLGDGRGTQCSALPKNWRLFIHPGSCCGGDVWMYVTIGWWGMKIPSVKCPVWNYRRDQSSEKCIKNFCANESRMTDGLSLEHMDFVRQQKKTHKITLWKRTCNLCVCTLREKEGSRMFQNLSFFPWQWFRERWTTNYLVFNLSNLPSNTDARKNRWHSGFFWNDSRSTLARSLWCAKYMV